MYHDVFVHIVIALLFILLRFTDIYTNWPMEGCQYPRHVSGHPWSPRDVCSDSSPEALQEEAKEAETNCEPTKAEVKKALDLERHGNSKIWKVDWYTKYITLYDNISVYIYITKYATCGYFSRLLSLFWLSWLFSPRRTQSRMQWKLSSANSRQTKSVEHSISCSQCASIGAHLEARI